MAVSCPNINKNVMVGNHLKAMDEIIKIRTNETAGNIVSARELYEKLGLDKSQWSRWSRMNITENEYFEENIDYEPLDIMSNGNNTKDYAIKIEMAKELCMLCRNKNGKQIRQYFIKIEEEYNSPEKIMARALIIANNTINNLYKEIERKENTIIKLVDKAVLDKKRQILNVIMRNTTYGDYQERRNNEGNSQDRRRRERYSRERRNELYRQFGIKYNIDIQRRFENYNLSDEPKVKNLLEYIDVVMNKLPELYEIAVKLYGNDIERLNGEIFVMDNDYQAEIADVETVNALGLNLSKHETNQITMACEIIRYIVPDENTQIESLDSGTLNHFVNNEFEAAVVNIICQNVMHFDSSAESRDFILEALSLALMVNSFLKINTSNWREDLLRRLIELCQKLNNETASTYEREVLLRQTIEVYKKMELNQQIQHLNAIITAA